MTTTYAHTPTHPNSTLHHHAALSASSSVVKQMPPPQHHSAALSAASASCREQFLGSPEPEGGSSVRRFRHDPYTTRVVVPEPENASLAPEGTRHVGLWGRVCFVQHPFESFHVPPECFPTREEATERVFFGQLPYYLTDMELNWFTMSFGGVALVDPERILKRQASGERLPTGCIHAYATPEGVDALIEGMHKRLLADDTGVWWAKTSAEAAVLAEYVSNLQANRALRRPGMPYETVVVERAKSRFVPHNPVLLRALPPPPPSPPPYLAPPPYAGLRIGAMAPPPPPVYDPAHLGVGYYAP